MPTARDIALIFLSLEALVMALIPLVLIGGLAYGVYRLHRWTQSSLRLAQIFVYKAHDEVERWSEKMAAPLIAMHMLGSRLKAIIERVIVRRSQ